MPDMPERIARREARRDPRHSIRAAASAAARPAVYTIVAMAYDQELAGRIRQLIGSDPELTEKKMFGGLAFLIRGNMPIAASSGDGAMVRVDPAQSDALVATTNATLTNMRGRDMPGWLRVGVDDLRTDDQLAHWVEIGTGYARSPAAQVEARRSAALQPPGPAALIVLTRRCVVRWPA
jgi:hypothetical protein